MHEFFTIHDYFALVAVLLGIAIIVIGIVVARTGTKEPGCSCSGRCNSPELLKAVEHAHEIEKDAAAVWDEVLDETEIVKCGDCNYFHEESRYHISQPKRLGSCVGALERARETVPVSITLSDMSVTMVFAESVSRCPAFKLKERSLL